MISTAFPREAGWWIVFWMSPGPHRARVFDVLGDVLRTEASLVVDLAFVRCFGFEDGFAGQNVVVDAGQHVLDESGQIARASSRGKVAKGQAMGLGLAWGSAVYEGGVLIDRSRRLPRGGHGRGILSGGLCCGFVG